MHFLKFKSILTISVQKNQNMEGLPSLIFPLWKNAVTPLILIKSNQRTIAKIKIRKSTYEQRETFNPYTKVTACLSVCLSVCRFSYVPGRFLTIFGEGTTTLPRDITKNQKKITFSILEREFNANINVKRNIDIF